jgi:hypothetical protein
MLAAMARDIVEKNFSSPLCISTAFNLNFRRVSKNATRLDLVGIQEYL